MIIDKWNMMLQQRHLKAMANMALSAKQEKDDKFQQIKREVAEMIKTQVLSPKSKVYIYNL